MKLEYAHRNKTIESDDRSMDNKTGEIDIFYNGNNFFLLSFYDESITGKIKIKRKQVSTRRKTRVLGDGHWVGGWGGWGGEGGFLTK